jgi:hypothetical protein
LARNFVVITGVLEMQTDTISGVLCGHCQIVALPMSSD